MLADVLTRLEVPFETEAHRHGRSGWLQICCPYCDISNTKYHLGIQIGTNRSNCWRCGPKYAPQVLAMITGQRIGVIQKMLPTGSFTRVQKATGTKKFKLPYASGGLQQAHKKYLMSRGFSPNITSNLWGIQGIGVSSPACSWRILIPIHKDQRIVSWTARAIWDGEERRYYSCEEAAEIYPHKDWLYGFDHVQDSCIVHEGPLDVWATGYGAVCTFGTSFTPAQVKLLSKLRRVVICYDSSPDAQQRAIELGNRLEPFPVEVINAQLEIGQDTAECQQLPGGSAEIQQLRELAFSF
jgi:hypothetical protein